MKKLFGLVDCRTDCQSVRLVLDGMTFRPTNFLRRLEQQGFGAELEAGGDGPHVAAAFIIGGEQFLLAGGGVGGYAGVESPLNVGQRGVGVAS